MNVAVAGATGYTGLELVRWLLGHPKTDLVRVTSEKNAGARLRDVHPSLSGKTDLVLEALDPERIADGVDIVLSALPHGAAASTVVAAVDRGVRVIDLSADFRLSDPETFARWYAPHPYPERLPEAVYGIPELHREEIRKARIVANPGCYPTGAIFAIAPFARAGVLGVGPVVVDSKSGASGAGRTNRTDLSFCEVDESVRAYSVGVHRHTPEITQALRRLGAKNSVVFTPHLLPIRRGILTTAYVPLLSDVDPSALLREAYSGEHFIHVLEGDGLPDVRDVRGTNDVHIAVRRPEGTDIAVVITAIDNLGRGAAAQAVQNLNVLGGFDETTGLDVIAAVP